MDDFTQRLVERTRARQEMMQQKLQNSSSTQQRKRRPLLSQNSEENLAIKMSTGKEVLEKDGISQSPNKRTRTDCPEDTENIVSQRSSSDSDVIQSRSKARQSGHHVNQRMQKLLNQRKIWEAEEQGHDISYDDASLPTPVIHDPPQEEAQTTLRKTQSLEHEGRKKRLAALAARVRGWEDDVAHHDPPKSPEKSPVHWKPPTGRIQQVSAVPVEKVLPQKTSTPVENNMKIMRQDSGELSVDSLARFAIVGKAAERRSPVKVQQNKSVISVGGNARTVLQTKQQTITVGSSHGQQMTQNSKTLQQRMLDLQSNGITEADIHAMNTSSANLIMERARAERAKELEELRNRKVHGMKIHGMTENKSDNDIKSQATTEEDKKANDLDDVDDDDNIMGANNDEIKDMETSAMEECDKKVDQIQNGSYLNEEDTSRAQCEDEFYTSACDKSLSEADQQANDEEQQDEAEEEQDDEDDEEGQELSYGDSLLDEDSTLDEENPSDQMKISNVESPSSSVACSESIENIEEKFAQVSVSEDKTEKEEACQMVDDLFEGVLSDEEKLILTPPPRTHSPITIPNLTRQKSKLEIKSELVVRKQTCNEAEDTHALTQPSKFQRTCLSKSNSTESIVSLCQDNELPVYTISSYRTEKRRQSIGRVDKRVVRNEAANAKAAMVKRQAPDRRPVNEIISDMMGQVSAQQRVIQQASAALNCCYDAQHGKGTITEVEAEKLLLISSERRLALLAEIQQLKQKRASAKDESSFKPCSGVVVVGGLRLPLRTEYIFSIANRRDAGELRNHYYFVLVRNGQQMFATQLVSTLSDLSGDSLVFKDDFTIGNLSSDFKIVLEVYSLNHRTRADGIPVQDKTKGKLSGILHKRKSGDVRKLFSGAVEKTKNKVKKSAATQKNIQQTDNENSNSKQKSDKSLTPKKLRTSKRTAHMPSMMSPGGPNAIRISNFSLIGSTTITLGAITGRKFTLQKVPFLSPISGQILCKFSSNFESSISQRGFLTMFDDVGGLGAWHRRWCALRQGKLYTWTYPDDEQYKKPLMSLALRECISREITTVERILCARPNTFELRTMRPRRQGDRQNLISEDTGSVITTKHWLSADTKEERVAWIESLNQALVDVRAWDMDALKPFK